MSHNWKFFRAGGFDQVRIDTAADLLNLKELDQKLWVALSCTVRGIEFDARSLALIDTDNDGNAYLVLREGNAVFKLDLRAQRLQRIAGTGESGYSGDGGPAIDCRFNGPKGIAWSVEDHSLYIVDTENHVIRRMDLASGIITTMLGTGSVADGPDGDPLQCALARPHGVFVHEGVVYVTDSENHRIRAVTNLPA